jgi:hypothetical protein
MRNQGVEGRIPPCLREDLAGSRRAVDTEVGFAVSLLAASHGPEVGLDMWWEFGGGVESGGRPRTFFSLLCASLLLPADRLHLLLPRASWPKQAI